MNNLTKSQVIALFLGSASATQTFMGIFNGPSSADTVPTGQALIDSSSGTVCTSNASCTTAAEKCGAFQKVGVAQDENFCISGKYCGSLGRIDNVAWSVQCWADAAQGATPTAPAKVDPAALVTGLEDLITNNDQWTNVANLFISSRYNYQDGWWALNTDGKWVETDKAADNRCFMDNQCLPQNGEERCCGTWPDGNNRRCMKKALHMTNLKVGPASFIPQCKEANITNVVPENAADDIAAGALARASEALTTFYGNQLADAKAKINYTDDAKCDKACKEKFDADQKVQSDARDAFIKELKKTAGFDTADCDDTCKSVFEQDLLKWEKDVYETCKADSKGIACRDAQGIKKDIETRRAGGDKNYYSKMTADERVAADKAAQEATQALESSLAAAFIKNNRPAAGEIGSICGPKSYLDGVVPLSGVVGSLFDAADAIQCPGADLCCGIATQKEGGNVKDKLAMCNKRAVGTTYTDQLGQVYNFECENAIKLASSIAAGVAVVYSLI